MFFKQRHPRRSSKFQSRWSRVATRRREYMASLLATILVQTFLLVFLGVLVFRTTGMMRHKFTHVPWSFRYIVPLLILAVAALVARTLGHNILRVVTHFRGRHGIPKS